MYGASIKHLFTQLEVPLHLMNHLLRVAAYVKIFGEVLHLNSHVIDQLFYGSLIHDIGKTGIHKDILLKPGKLTDEEYAEIKRHPLIGYTLIEPIKHLSELLPIIRNHHERIDGRGYPDGLSGEEIPLAVRIVTIADAFDAMTSYRFYSPSSSIAEAIHELLKERGKQFDSELVDRFIQGVIPALVPARIQTEVDFLTNTLSVNTI